jgi:hypothetical protein
MEESAMIEKLQKYLVKAEELARRRIDEQIDEVYPGQAPLEEEIRRNMPQRYFEANLSTCPSSKGELIDKMNVHQQLLAACNLLEAKGMLPQIEELSEHELETAYRFFMVGAGFGILHGRDQNFVEALKPIHHSEGQAKARRVGHKEDNDRRQQLLDQFEEHALERIKDGYTGTGTALVRAALKLREFKELREAVTSSVAEDGQIRARAFLKEERLVKLANSLLKAS